MGIFCGATLAFVLALAAFAIRGDAQPLVPAVVTFGDSAVDVGNNDYIHTIYKANYPPYGRDFVNHQPTGRFCNGKLATDLTAETLGFTTYAPAYLSPQASGKNLLIGANFASAASGYDDHTAYLNHAIPLSQQLDYYKEYQGKLAQVAGSKQAASIIKDALYLVSAGSSDFFQNYYVNPFLNKVYTPDQYSSYLVGIFSSFIKDLHKLGARRIGVTSLPPLGCLPATRTLFGSHENGCVSTKPSLSQNLNAMSEFSSSIPIILQNPIHTAKFLGFRYSTFKSSHFGSKINFNLAKNVVKNWASTVYDAFCGYREGFGFQIEAFWRNYRVLLGAGGIVLSFVLWRIRVLFVIVGLSQGMAKYGFLALSTAIVIVIFAVTVVGVTHSGTHLRAHVMSGSGFMLKNFKSRFRSKRRFLVFPGLDYDRKGLLIVEVKNKIGQYDKKLLAVDTPMAIGPDQCLFLIDMKKNTGSFVDRFLNQEIRFQKQWPQ